VVGNRRCGAWQEAGKQGWILWPCGHCIELRTPYMRLRVGLVRWIQFLPLRGTSTFFFRLSSSFGFPQGWLQPCFVVNLWIWIILEIICKFNLYLKQGIWIYEYKKLILKNKKYYFKNKLLL
jgi:hypothetical protein